MRGDVVFRVYGCHDGREQDSCFGAYRTEEEARAEIAKLQARVMNGENWAARYHNKGFVVRLVAVETDFELPSLPKPRDAYAVKITKRNAPGTWDSSAVEVFRRSDSAGLQKVGEYVRNYAMLHTFEPFRQGGRDYALISRNYTRTAVLDLATGRVIAEETESAPGSGAGFCPVGFYVPDWWDVHDGSIIPGSESWNEDREWPRGDWGFVWGCYWGDDTSWKVQHLDLRHIREGIIKRDDRFGYVALATHSWNPPWKDLERSTTARSRAPEFIRVSRYDGASHVGFDVELEFDLESGAPESAG